jgi:hypothetical protein
MDHGHWLWYSTNIIIVRTKRDLAEKIATKFQELFSIEKEALLGNHS